MKRGYRVLGWVAGLTVAALFVVYVIRALHGRDLSAYSTPSAFCGILLAALCWTACLPLIALAWRGMLAAVGVHKTLRELTSILGITQFAKYVPGNIAQYLGRAGMSVSRGIPARAFGVTITLEMLLAIAAAMVTGVGAGTLSIAGRAFVHQKSGQLTLIAVVLVATAAALVVFKRIAPTIVRRFAPHHAHAFEDGLLPSLTAILIAFVLYLLVYACLGLGLVILAHLLLPNIESDNWLLVASFSLAWIVGFVTPGAPAGLGVREGLLLLMLAPTYSSAAASILVIALRLATTLGDVVNFLGGLLVLPKSPSMSGSRARG